MGLFGFFKKKPQDEPEHTAGNSAPEDPRTRFQKACAIEDPQKRFDALLPFTEIPAGDSFSREDVQTAMLQAAFACEQMGDRENMYHWFAKAAKAGSFAAYYEWGTRTLEAAAELTKQGLPDGQEFLEDGLSMLCDAAGGGIRKAVQALTAYNHVSSEAAAAIFQPILDRKLGEWAKINEKYPESPKAQYTMGLWYFYGVGYEQDLDQAREWFEKAAAQGNTGAAEMLKNPLLEEF